MQLQFEARADDWVKQLCVEQSAQVRILGLKFVGSGREVAHFVDIALRTGSPGEARQWLDSTPSVRSTELTDLSQQHMMGVVVANKCMACPCIIGMNTAVFVSSARTGDNCSVGYKVFLGNDGVPLLLTRLSKEKVAYAVKDIGPVSPDFKLTTRQLGILRSAMDMGFYDFPRRISLTELAGKIGIKPSTLSEILRAAEKSILGSFLSEDDEIEQ
ncbi:MAG TPA: helix-turn-helix domain-containing protein [Nitrososphaerales archaeon]|nr:helix-turn-helix domain-containing protein [Nitrososphaerales archaeon]